MKHASIKLNPEDMRFVEALQRYTGEPSVTGILRQALRDSARAKGITVEPDSESEGGSE